MLFLTNNKQLKGPGSSYFSPQVYRPLPVYAARLQGVQSCAGVVLGDTGWCSSEPRTWLLQKLDFLIGRFPAEDAVSVRIAAEPFNDRFVFQFEIEAVLVAIVLEQPGGDLMDLQRLAVHERHVEEATLGLIQ